MLLNNITKKILLNIFTTKLLLNNITKKILLNIFTKKITK